MIKVNKLPYATSALQPFISKKTFKFHYEKHYMGYLNTTNNLIEGTELKDKSLKQIILTAASDSIYTKLFNNASQTWNHEFYWNSLTPYIEKHNPSSDLLLQINKTFCSVKELQNTLVDKGLNQFGSGWVWLVSENGILKVMTTSNAETPLTNANLIPLLCLDVWEHAYYLDYQNLRKDYLTNLVQNLLNWEFASQNLQKGLC